MFLSVFVCMAGLIFLVWMLRRTQLSLGMPVAYLFSLLLIHVPGAIAHLVDANDLLANHELTETGIRFTAIGTFCFVMGVWVSRHWAVKVPPIQITTARPVFWQFCLLAGWFFTSLGAITDITTIGAVIDGGGAIWMIGVMLGLRAALARGDKIGVLRWLGALAVYPLLIFLLGGFLSYGAAAAIIVVSCLTITTRSNWRLIVTVAVGIVIGMSAFLTYFQHRREIREAVWGGADMQARVDATMAAVRDFHLFSSDNPADLQAFDDRLNQNYFAGLAAKRIDDGVVDYLYGRSVKEGLMAVIPRALWPEKPVTAGSPQIVAEMTGLRLAKGTSFGVGNVMEFQINFGTIGIVVGFLLLGWALGRLDRLAAVAEASGNLGSIALYFLPAVALIQPNGSIVELTGGAAAGLAAALGWRWVWTQWPKPMARVERAPAPLPRAQGVRRPIVVGRQPRQLP